MQAARFMGIDIAKAHLDVAVRPSGESWPVRHDEAGLAQVVERRQAGAPRLIVVEATGGLETVVGGAGAGAGWPVVARGGGESPPSAGLCESDGPVSEDRYA